MTQHSLVNILETDSRKGDRPHQSERLQIHSTNVTLFRHTATAPISVLLNTKANQRILPTTAWHPRFASKLNAIPLKMENRQKCILFWNVAYFRESTTQGRPAHSRQSSEKLSFEFHAWILKNLQTLRRWE